MPFINEKYSQQKIDNLYNYLQSSKEQGEPEDYEIFVDAFKVVKRTNDLSRFETYSNYVQPETKSITIVIYDGSSPRNTKHIFTLKEENQSLNGLEVDSRIEDKIKVEKERWETELLKKENEKLRTELTEAEAYIEELEENIEKGKDKKFRLGDVNMGELASVVLEGMIRRNPQMLAKLPGGEALAGVIEQDNQDKERLLKEAEPEPEVSFKKKENSSSDKLSEEDESYLNFIRQLKDKFDHEQMTSVMLILDVLSKSPNDIEPTIQFLADLHKK
jgi:hypothetical protein